MDEYSGKRAVNELVVSRKGSGLVLRETPNNRDSNTQFCNRLGCNGRLNTTKGTQNGKSKPLRPSVRPSYSGKEIVGSSSRTCTSVSNPRKSIAEPCKSLSSHIETDSSETSSVQDEPEVAELNAPPGKIQRGLHLESKNAESSEVSLMEVGSSSVASNTRPRRNFEQKSGTGNQTTLAGPSSSSGSRSLSMKANASTTRYGLRNLRCNSISDVVPSNCSSSDSSLGRRRELVKKRNSEGESSSAARGKKINGLSSAQNPSSNSISVSESRRARNTPPNGESGVASVRTRRSINSQTRTRISNQGIGNSLSRNASPVVISQRSHANTSMDMSDSGSSQLISTEASLSRSNSYGRSGRSSESIRGTLPSGLSEVGLSRSSLNRDSLRRYNIDGIAEVLLALERIEQDEELTFEQILALETNLFLNGISFHDQHRDMRLDIDNMSYEELLALEERMGSVSTALTEEALSECLKRSIYQSMPLEDADAVPGSNGDNDDVKCSICQEEYVGGDEVGRLHCEHRYHVVCIQQWLRLKNWCPICKSSAAPSPSSTPSPVPPSST